MAAAQNFICAIEQSMRSACANPERYARFGANGYCILHLPMEKNETAFTDAIAEKSFGNNYNFRGVWFPNDIDFSNKTFPKDVDFTSCTFHADVTFHKSTFAGKADFSNATFEGDLNFSGITLKSHGTFSNSTFGQFADFSGSEFELGANFRESDFQEVALFATGFGNSTDFSGVDFVGDVEFSACEFKKSVWFIGTTFHNATDFTDTTFDDEVSFDLAVFKDSARFGKPEGGREVFGDDARLSLENARIEKPERFSFYSMRLKPSWFLNVDVRKLDFTNVTWFKTGIDENFSVFGPVHKLLAITYRQLALNAEEHHRYSEASDFRYLAMDVRRFERMGSSRVRWRKFAFWQLTWWYWLASGYGERVYRAAVGLIAIWILFAFLYSTVGFARWEPRVTNQAEVLTAVHDISGAPLPFARALPYSAGVLTLQKPEPRPATTVAKSLVLLETVLGPIQAALLALAIRRKFIR